MNIYTDSRYAYGVVHDFGFLWEHRGFLTSSGKVVRHADLIQDLLEKVKLPKTIAVIKCQAHKRTNDPITMGNNRADEAAKQAALLLLQGSSKENVTMDTLTTLQNQVGPQTLSKWKNAGCKQIDKVWKHEDGRLCAPPSLYPILAHLSHLPSHISKGGMIASVKKFWVAPGFPQYATDWCKKCMICAKHNPGKMTKVEMKHLVKPDYPFQRLQIDYIQLPKCGVYEYVLVCRHVLLMGRGVACY